MLIEDGLCPLLEGPEQDEGLDPETKAENPSRHVPVFSNAIYHDNEYARYCYRGHFKIQKIIY